MRKMILALILAGLLLAEIGCGGGKGAATGSADPTLDVAAKDTIDKYFTEYFDSQKTLTFSKMNNNILTDNENTQLNEAFREVLVTQKDLFGNGISSYQYRINYGKTSASGNILVVKLTLDLDLHYTNAPADMKSGIYGVNYTFTLQKNGTAWVIAAIDSDLEEFQAFKYEVETKRKENRTLSQSEAIAQVRNTLQTDLKLMRNNSLYLKGAAIVEQAGGGATFAPNSNISKSVYVSSQSYSYNPDNAALYAQRYAKATESDRIFYTAKDPVDGSEVDCTNFISQCVWAGYGGYVKDDDTATKNNIQNKIGMVYDDWFAGTGGGSAQWENVRRFFTYMVTPKFAGPNATTDFANYDEKRHYTTVPAASIKVGDVLQLWIESAGGYNHSLFVTSKTNNTASCTYNQIYICSHTTNRLNLPLGDIIYSWSYKYLRRLTPAADCYLK